MNANIAEYQTGLAEHYGHSIHVKSPEKLHLNLAFEEKFSKTVDASLDGDFH